MIVKELLQGRPLKHPLHPILVHFPVGLWVLSLVLDLITILFGPNYPLVRGAFYAMVGGTIMAVLASIPGLVDWADIRADHPAKKIATNHMWLNFAAIVVYALNIVLRLAELDEVRTPTLPLILSIVGIVIISVSGYLGGMVVYDDGIAVGRHRRHPATPHETVHAETAKGDQFIAVADAESLKDGELLRAEVNGNVMAIARVGSDFYAFQEFCTHRYGPLSEGALEDGQVQCPWHRSCFDIKSGKVTQGPAKVDLKTFEVQVKDGKVMVKAGKT
ncbi:MAG TPA: DUF2231 domain-containing protein [Chloroflexia bacterium]|nr:DUF2231 domain-containing protein [Chloroflexia bacterium]